MLKKSFYLILVLFLLVITAFKDNPNNSATNNTVLYSEKDAVRKVVEDSYANGAFNKLDTDAMENVA